MIYLLTLVSGLSLLAMSHASGSLIKILIEQKFC